MTLTQREERRRLWNLDRGELEAYQLGRFNQLLLLLPENRFYQEKLGLKQSDGKAVQLEQWSDFKALPFTTKEELIEAGEQGTWQTFATDRYVRFHQTSGTSGRPLTVLDTAEDWNEWIDTWQHVLDVADIKPGETAMLAFSFGPFIGFWSAFDALVARGVRAVPGGGMTSASRLDLIERTGATSLFCTPSYALHLAETGRQLGTVVADLPIKTIVVAGEPGGSLPAVRSRIETLWNARVVDHAGASEVGPWGFGDDLWSKDVAPGLRIIESSFLAEFFSVETGEPAVSGELSHLVLTNLGRVGSPVIRYRTGDLVRPEWPAVAGGTDSTMPACQFVRLAGGVLGRADDMMVIRGVNVFPAAIEQILREFPEVAEFQMIATKRGEMAELRIAVEDAKNEPARIADALQIRLGLRTEVFCVAAGSLPRSEAKSRRFIRKD